VALVLRSALGAGPLAGVEVASLVGAALAVGLVKNGYQPLVLLALVIPPARLRGVVRWLGFAAGLLLAVSVPAALWLLAVSDAAPGPASPGADPAAQLRHVLADPTGFLAVVFSTTWSQLGLWGRSFVGLLGTATTWLPAPLYAAWVVSLPGVAIADGPLPAALGTTQRALLGLSFVGCALAVLATAYIGWNQPGASQILGVQGRYFVPAAPALLLALPALARPIPEAVRAGILFFAATSALVTLAAVVERYYVF
jgi:uncharacterized membrane protein